jgi:hypothetical protein
LTTRRHFIQFAGAAFAPWSVIWSFAADFWNTKDPDSWTTDEIAKLLKKSPWAKEVTGERTTTKKVTDPTMSPMPGPTVRTRSNPMGLPGSKPPKATSKTVTQYKGEVVWESAKVIRDAQKTPLPDGFDGQYVLSVKGIPLSRSSSQSALDRLRQATLLQLKGKDPLEPATVQQNTGNGATYYIGFSKEALPISKDDKDLVFTTHMGKVVFTAKFNPKEMLYHGELAV